jgi:hypothetical protein
VAAAQYTFVILDLGHCNVSDFCYLRFEICHLNVKISTSVKRDACGQRQC